MCKADQSPTTRILFAGLRDEFAKYKAERQKKEEPIEAKVLNAVLSSSATPYRQLSMASAVTLLRGERDSKILLYLVGDMALSTRAIVTALALI